MEISRLQWFLTNLNKDNFAEITKEIRETKFIHERLEDLVFEILNIYKIRPEKESILVRFVEFMTKYESDWNSLGKLSSSIFNFSIRPKTHREDSDHVLCIRFVRKLFEKRLISLQKISAACKKPSEYNQSQVIYLMCFFLPELISTEHDWFVAQCSDIVEHYTLNDKVKSMLQNPEALKKEEVLDIMDNAWKEGSIESFVKKDDHRSMRTHCEFKAGYQVPPNVFDQNELVRKGCSLLKFAAFYGAVNCFQYLLCTEKIDQEVCDAAVAGGNDTIIKIVKDNGIDVTRSLMIAAEFRQYDFMKEYITPEVCKTDAMKEIVDEVLEKCMFTNNVGLMIFLYNIGILQGKINKMLITCASNDTYLESFKILTLFKDADINTKDAEGWTPLHKAASMGSLKIIKHLCTIPGLDVNARDNLGRTPLHVAAASDELEVVAFLISITIVDPNCLDNWERTPLHHACANNATLVTKYLVKVKKVIINRTDKIGRTPKEIAPPGSDCIEIIEAAELNLHN